MAGEQDTNEPIDYRDDVNSDVAAAIASLKGEAAPEPEAPEEPPAEATEEAAPVVERARDANGKFIAKEQSIAPEAPKSPSTDDTTKPSAEQVSTPVGAAPVSWAADAKASWANLPPAIQNAVIKREQEVSNGFRQKSEELRRYETSIAPIAQEAQRMGLNVEQGIQRLMDGHRFLQEQPEQAIMWLAQRHGIDLSNLATNPPAARQPVRADPMFAQVSQHVQSLQERLDAMTTSQNMSVVEAFAQANPHYADVEESLPDLIKEVQRTAPHLSPSETLQQAYDRAVWLNPDVRNKMIAEQTQAQQQTKVTQLADKAKAASKAAVSVKGSSASVAPPQKQTQSGETVYDDVRAALQQLRTA